VATQVTTWKKRAATKLRPEKGGGNLGNRGRKLEKRPCLNHTYPEEAKKKTNISTYCKRRRVAGNAEVTVVEKCGDWAPGGVARGELECLQKDSLGEKKPRGRRDQEQGEKGGRDLIRWTENRNNVSPSTRRANQGLERSRNPNSGKMKRGKTRVKICRYDSKGKRYQIGGEGLEK